MSDCKFHKAVTTNRSETFQPSYPYHMVWLATNACNARCVHCSTEAIKRLPGELTTEEAKGMFAELADIGVLDVAVSGGEPLTRHDMFEILEYAANLRIQIGLGSNGSTITDKVVRHLKHTGLDRLQISIDGLEETHDRARRWKGLFEKSRSAIEKGLAGGLRVHVCFTAHSMNHRELKAVIEQCLEWGVTRFNLSRFVPTGRGDRSLDLDRSEWKKILTIYDVMREEYQHEMEFTTHLAQLVLSNPVLDCQTGFIGCQAGSGQGCIGPRGEVTPCVMLPVVVGNIREDRLKDIWKNSTIIQSLRDRSKLKGQCQSCTFRDKCGGCRAVAFSYTRDYLAADPRCWLKKTTKISMSG